MCMARAGFTVTSVHTRRVKAHVTLGRHSQARQVDIRVTLEPPRAEGGPAEMFAMASGDDSVTREDEVVARRFLTSALDVAGLLSPPPVPVVAIPRRAQACSPSALRGARPGVPGLSSPRVVS